MAADPSPRGPRKDRPLRTVLRWHVLGTALVPLLVIEVSLLVLYLAFGREVAGLWREELTQELRSSLQAVVDARAQELSLTLAGVEHQTELVRTQAGMLLREEVLPPDAYRPELYAKGKGGALYQRVDDGGASIFYSASTLIGEVEQRKIAATEPLDPTLCKAVEADPHVVAAYLNTHDDFNRYCPFIADAAEQFPAELQMEEFAFYYAADAAHDPERRVVWTEAYLDPAGNGWMVSSVAPVYRGDFLEGVVGLDVTIPTIAERLLDLHLPYRAPALLMTADGKLLGLSRDAAQAFAEGAAILDRAPSKIERGSEERSLDQETPLAQLLGDPQAAAALQARVQDAGPLTELRVGGDTFFLLHASIADPAWTVVLLVDAGEVMAPVETIESRSKTIALWVLGGMAVFYALFFQVVYRRSQRLADRLAVPLGHLERAAEAKRSPVTMHSGIFEIDVLSRGFREMMDTSLEHQERIESLNRTLADEIEEEVRKSRVKDHQLLEQSRLVSLGEMVASIAHQWRQPLASMQFLVDDLRMQLEDDDARDSASLVEDLDDAQQLIDHMNRTIDDFRALYRSSDESEALPLRMVVDRALSVADGGLKSFGVEVVVEDAAGGAVVEGRPNELCHVVLNLLSNARAILSEREVAGPRVVIRLGVEGQSRFIEVEDNGGGVDPQIAGRLFEAFASTRSEGTGLGLYMSRRLVVERFGGTLEVQDGAAGACFRVELPRPSEDEAEPEATA